MGRYVVDHIEDIALGLGGGFLIAGCWATFGAGIALMLGGVLLVAYGVWVTPKKGG